MEGEREAFNREDEVEGKVKGSAYLVHNPKIEN